MQLQQLQQLQPVVLPKSLAPLSLLHSLSDAEAAAWWLRSSSSTAFVAATPRSDRATASATHRRFWRHRPLDYVDPSAMASTSSYASSVASFAGLRVKCPSTSAVFWAAGLGVSLKQMHRHSHRRRIRIGARFTSTKALHQLSAKSSSNEDLDLGLSDELVVKVKENAKRKTGVLLINIGTPASTDVGDVRDYLQRFLADDRVFEIEPPLLKWIVLQAVLFTRPASSAANYRKIWDPERGSPLLFHSQDLVAGLQEELGHDFEVRLGFQYSEPYLPSALKSLAEAGVDDVILVPMFPHYASGTTGGCLAAAYKTAADLYCTPFLSVLPPFYGHPGFVSATKKAIGDVIGNRGDDVDHLLFSFHGLPEEQCSRTDTSGTFCNKSADCCARLNKQNRNCYRAQCFETARILAFELGLPESKWSIAFQSRLTLRGAIQWIRPYTDEAFATLPKQGVKKLAVVAPSFTADCVETLEELGITGRETFAEAGGEELVLVSCLNSSDSWVRNLSAMLREHVVDRARSVSLNQVARLSPVETNGSSPKASEPVQQTKAGVGAVLSWARERLAK